MSINDIIFTVGAVIFTLALIPSILGKNKPEISSSLLTAVVLTTYVWNCYDLGLTFSAVTTVSTALCWWILAWQGYKRKK